MGTHLWRGLLRALARRGHRITFFEKDVTWYASHRDLHEIPHLELVLYPSWEDVRTLARSRVAECDAALVTSYCPDAQNATDLMNASNALRIFYDLDTPVTLHRLRAGEHVDYVPERGYSDFDLVMSYTGRALNALTTQLGAKCAIPIYGSVDPTVHYPVHPVARWRGDLSYLERGLRIGRRPLIDCLSNPHNAGPTCASSWEARCTTNRFRGPRISSSTNTFHPATTPRSTALLAPL